MISRQEDKFYFDLREDPEEVASALQEIFATTEIGREYLKKCFTQDQWPTHYELIVSTAERRVGPRVNADTLAGVLATLMQTHRIAPWKATSLLELVEPAEDKRPVDKNGKRLTLNQVAWGEMRRWAESHSSEECRQRAKTDAKFASFMHTNLEREAACDPRAMYTIAGAPKPLTATGDRLGVTKELEDFAFKYQRESCENLRPKSGYVILAGERMLHSELLELVDRAANAGLLGGYNDGNLLDGPNAQ